MKATKTGQYNASKVIIEGNKKTILNFLRAEALTMREQSRQTIKGYDSSVHALYGKEKHTSEIVNLASFKIKQMNIEQLLPLMNAHGVMTYVVNNN